MPRRAHLTALRRARVGSLGLDRAITLDELETWNDHLLSPGDALGDLPGVSVSAEIAQAVRSGTPLVGSGAMSGAPVGEPYRVHDDRGDLIAVYQRTGERAAPVVVLPS